MPIDPKDVQWDAAPAIDSSKVQWDAEPPQEEKALGPWASAVVRPLAKGVAALPLMAMDAGVAARNLITGENYEHPSQMFNRALDAYTTTPEGVGKGAEFVSSALAGGGVGAPSLAAQAPTAAAPAIAKSAQALPRAIFSQTPGAGAAAQPVAQASTGVLRRTLEKMGAGELPITGKILQSAREDALKAWNVRLLKQIDQNIQKGGPEGFQQATNSLKAAYGDIWKSELDFNRAGLRDAWTQLASQVGQKLPKEASESVIGTLRHQFSQVLAGARPGGTQGTTLEAVDDALREAAKKAAKAGDGAVAAVYNQARTSFRSQFDPTVSKALATTDELYMKLATLRNAAKKNFGETITPDKLMSASMKKSSEAAVAEGRGVFQKEAAEAAEEMGLPTSTFQRRIEDAIGNKAPGVLKSALGLTLSPVALAARMSAPKATPSRVRALASTLAQMEQD